jgi:hypothetical protein
LIRRGSAAGILPLVAFLYGLGYYGTRSVTWARAMEAGVDSSDLASAIGVTSGAGVAGAVLAAVLGALVGPSAVAALGLATAGCACLLAPSSWGMLLASCATLGFGAGMYRPALYAAAARPWRITEGAGVALVLVLAYVGVNGAALAASPLAEWLHGTLPVAVGPLGALVLFVAAGLAAVDAGVQQLAPPTEPETAWDPRAVGAAAGVAIGVALLQALWTLGSNARFDSVGPAFQASPWLQWLDPAAVIAVGLLAAAVLAVAAAIGGRVPLLLLAGAGFAAIGATFVATEALGWLPPNVALVGAAVGIGGAAEVAAVPLGMAAAGRGVYWRASTAVVAVPTVAVGGVAVISGLLPSFPFVGAATGVALIVGGLAAAAAAIPLDRWLLAPEDIGRPGAGS